MCLSRKVSRKETQGVKLSRGVILRPRLRACHSRNERGGSEAQAGSRVAVILSQYEIKVYLCATKPLGCLFEKRLNDLSCYICGHSAALRTLVV